MKEVIGTLEAKGMKIGIVASRFNSFLTEQLIKGAIDAFVRMGGDEKALTLVRVPGAYEIPLVVKRMAMKKFDALINQATAKAFCEISVDTGVPIIDGIVSAENLEQAVERCGTKQGNKGFSAMQSAIEMVNVVKKV